MNDNKIRLTPEDIAATAIGAAKLAYAYDESEFTDNLVLSVARGDLTGDQAIQMIRSHLAI